MTKPTKKRANEPLDPKVACDARVLPLGGRKITTCGQWAVGHHNGKPKCYRHLLLARRREKEGK